MAKTTILGEELKDGQKTGQKVEVVVWRRQSGMYVCGVQGSGKSGLLYNLILQDIKQGQAVIVVDPHGDLVDDVVASMPEDKLEKTYVLDIADRDFPYGLNMFSVSKQVGETERDIALNFVMHVFGRLWHDSQGILLDKYLTNIAAVFLENPHHSLADIPRFLHDQAFRNQLTRHLKNIFVKAFWEIEFNAMTPSERRREVNALTNRINIFLSNPLVANIVAQNASTIDFRRAIEKREIILIKFSKNLTKVAAIIGTMLISYIHQATFSFADTARVERPTFSLFVDEFQNFVTDDFAELFTEGRKFGVRTTIAHQDRKRLFGANASSSLTANTIVSFKPTPDDASELAPLFVSQKPRVQPEDIYRNVLDHLYEHSSPAIVAFWNTYCKRLIGSKDTYFTESFNTLLYEAQKNKQVNERRRLYIIKEMARLSHLNYQVYYDCHYCNDRQQLEQYVEKDLTRRKLEAEVQCIEKALACLHWYEASDENVMVYFPIRARDSMGGDLFERGAWDVVKWSRFARFSRAITADKMSEKEWKNYSDLLAVGKNSVDYDKAAEFFQKKAAEYADVARRFANPHAILSKLQSRMKEALITYDKAVKDKWQWVKKDFLRQPKRDSAGNLEWYITNRADAQRPSIPSFPVNLWNSSITVSPMTEMEFRRGVASEKFLLQLVGRAMTRNEFSEENVINALQTQCDYFTWLQDWDTSEKIMAATKADIQTQITALTPLLEIHKKEYEKQVEVLMQKVNEWLTKEKHRHDAFVASLDSALSTLISEPLGKKTIPTKSEVAQTLLSLPQRHALVRVGTDIYTMQTLQTLPKVPVSEQQRRYKQVQEQTREKYCRKRSDVEKALQEKHVIHHKEKVEVLEDVHTESEQAEWPRFEEVDNE